MKETVCSHQFSKIVLKTNKHVCYDDDDSATSFAQNKCNISKFKVKILVKYEFTGWLHLI